MITVRLRPHLKGPILILPAPTGVTYQAQCDGCACDQRSLEGYLVPIRPIHGRSIFDVDTWYCHGAGGNWEKAADLIESSLNNLAQAPPRFRVLRDEDNVEAWVHVEVDWVDGETYRGILTWENSD